MVLEMLTLSPGTSGGHGAGRTPHAAYTAALAACTMWSVSSNELQARVADTSLALPRCLLFPVEKKPLLTKMRFEVQAAQMSPGGGMALTEEPGIVASPDTARQTLKN